MIHIPFCTLSLDRVRFKFETGAIFRGLTITEGPHGYNVILRATLRGNKPVYALAETNDPAAGLADLLEILCQRNGYKVWRRDKYVYSTPDN